MASPALGKISRNAIASRLFDFTVDGNRYVRQVAQEVLARASWLPPRSQGEHSTLIGLVPERSNHHAGFTPWTPSLCQEKRSRRSRLGGASQGSAARANTTTRR